MNQSLQTDQAGDTFSAERQPGGDEITQLKEQLRHAQKLACLGTSAAMLAHEYNNMYTPVISYAQYALDQNDLALMRKTLQMILSQSNMVQEMSDRILGLARQERQPIASVRLREVIEHAVACIGRDLSKDGIQLSVDIDEALVVRGRQILLQQVFLNLILNARQALLERKGQIKISATPISAGQVTIHVRDNGKGIKQDDLARIFDPFFTTKRDENRQDKRGIGLGLAVCKDIIEEHDGSLTVESIEGHGTTFTVALPLEPASQVQSPR